MPNPIQSGVVPMSAAGVPMSGQNYPELIGGRGYLEIDQQRDWKANRNLQPPDPTQQFTQRLETSLNPKIGVPGQDTDPAAQASFMLKEDPQGAVKLAQTIMQAVQQKMMQARQMMMMRQAQAAQMGGMGMPQAQAAPAPQTMQQGMPQ